MAISPQEAAELNEHEIAGRDLQETEIDAYLRRHYRHGGGPLDVPIDNLTDRIIDSICQRYRAMGWAQCEHSGNSRRRWLIMDSGRNVE